MLDLFSASTVAHVKLLTTNSSKFLKLLEKGSHIKLLMQSEHKWLSTPELHLKGPREAPESSPPVL